MSEAPEGTERASGPAAVRLKKGVRARSLADEGVALSMGATAVVVRGARAETVWRALEPALRAGFTREAVVGRFPVQGRPFLEGVLDELEEHGFLREAEDEHELSESELVAYPHLEALTPRPFAALRALAESTVLVRSECPRLEAEVRRALARAGFREVRGDTAPATGALLTTRLVVPGGGEALHLVDAGHGVWLSGPRDACAGPELVRGVRAWFERLGPGGDGGAWEEPDESALSVTRALVAAQLALALVAHVARTVRGAPAGGPSAPPATDPEFMVTTDELVSEPHPFVALPVLDPGRAEPFTPGAAPPEDLTRDLDAVAHLWDRVFGPVGEPRPDDLEQLPVGLARTERSDVHGCGFTTAEARRDALLGALHAVAWPGEADPAAGRGLGLTPTAAAGEAVGDLVLRADDRWKPDHPRPTASDRGFPHPSPDGLSAPARRMWAALTLRFGTAADLRFHEWDGSGLWRAEVVDAEGERLGASAAPDADAAAREALLRAVARVQLARDPSRSGTGASVPASATRTDAVASALAAWARDTGLVRVSAPGRARAWAARGVHAAVAEWT
ncbi:hypothetical protein ACFXKD_25690 [Nocardiopsis aegyptia]|uniref:hypothetical protein n=1 Tax=Nocardiopsis aegyptia TaxID=220378 RepID=UPI00366C7DEE